MFKSLASNITERTVKFLNSFRDVYKYNGLTFECIYYNVVSSGDCDYVIEYKMTNNVNDWFNVVMGRA